MPLVAIILAYFKPNPPAAQVVVRAKPRHWYHFLTTTCAIIGGVFTVAGIVDSLLYNTLKLAKKARARLYSILLPPAARPPAAAFRRPCRALDRARFGLGTVFCCLKVP
jgi:hypothetical protein